MLVWGGLIRTNGSDFDDGAAYDPASHTWTMLPPPPLTPRSSAVAVWTGEEMIVWGGAGDESLADGAAYDPSTAAWRMLEPSPLSARVGAVAVWTGEEMVVFGGCSNAGTFGDGAAYHPIERRWRLLAPAPGPTRCFPASAWAGGQMVVWGGGTDDTGSSTVNGALYDPASDTWTEMSSSPLKTAGSDHAIAWTGREVLLWRGLNGVAYEPATDLWRELPAPPHAGSYSVAVWTGEEPLVWGTETGGDSDGAAYRPSG